MVGYIVRGRGRLSRREAANTGSTVFPMATTTLKAINLVACASHPVIAEHGL